jgi:hypothetical protein
VAGGRRILRHRCAVTARSQRAGAHAVVENPPTFFTMDGCAMNPCRTFQMANTGSVQR